MEITHFEGIGLNGLCPNESFFLTEGRLLEGEKGLAYWCTPAILHSPFSLPDSLFFSLLLLFLILFILFSFLSAYLSSNVVILS